MFSYYPLYGQLANLVGKLDIIETTAMRFLHTLINIKENRATILLFVFRIQVSQVK